MRARVLVVSVAFHGVLAALLVPLAVHRTPSATSSVAIELVGAPSPIVAATPVAEPTAAAKKGSDPISSTSRQATSAPVRRGGGGGKKGADPISDPRGEIRMESAGEGDSVGSGRGEGDGVGDGVGHGIGDGVGLGVGDASSAAALASLAIPAAPPAPKISKARPAILIYPKKHGSDDDTSIFIAQVTIDDEGYVVGAHVMKGEGGPRGAQASDLIWRFRYDPARDDDGKPIRSTIEQPFLVGR